MRANRTRKLGAESLEHRLMLTADAIDFNQTADVPLPMDGDQSVAAAVILPGDANGDRTFDQLDISQVLQAGKYLTGAPAAWSEGDWNGDTVFDQRDIVVALQTGTFLQSAYRSQGAVKTHISGTLPGGGMVIPEEPRITDGGTLHIRGQMTIDDPVEGDWVGTQVIELNLDQNLKTGVGVVHNRVTASVTWVDRGLSGVFAGTYTGHIRDGVVANSRAIFHGSGDFEGMTFVGEANGVLGQPFHYEGIILEPRGA